MSLQKLEAKASSKAEDIDTPRTCQNHTLSVANPAVIRVKTKIFWEHIKPLSFDHILVDSLPQSFGNLYIKLYDSKTHSILTLVW